MARPRVVRTALVTVASIVVLVLVAVVVGGVVVLRRPLPASSGTLTLSGLSRPVTVTRDARGVPTITASSATDLFRAQGFVAAQDRFFQMDYRRHVTAGRLSELVGADPRALEADKVVRTLGWHRVAEQEWGLLDATTQSYLTAYAEGVNAYLATRDPGSIAVEYTVLGLRVQVAQPEPWQPVDSLAWLKAMAWDLRSNYEDELGRARAYRTIGDVGKVDELFPPYPQQQNAPILPSGGDATVVPTAARAQLPLGDGQAQDAFAAADRALTAVPVLLGAGAATGSNSWAVSGAHTASGKPILANDPHLELTAPGIWSQVGLRCQQVSADCPFDVSGFGFAGMPGVVIGHDAKLAWGLTNMGADVTDLFLERIDDRSGTQLVNGAQVPLQVRHETIRVNGADDVDLVVRTTTHGPIISDVLDLSGATSAPTPDRSASAFQVSLGWTASTPGRTAEAIFRLDAAATAADVAAAAALFDVPAQNIVFATTDGHIGYQAPGRIPIRETVPGAVPSDGSWPRPGWDSAYDWQGWVPSAQLPHVLDPPEGFVVAANQAVLPQGTGPFLTADYDMGYRSQRIRTLLTQQIAAGKKIDVASTQAVQDDTHSPMADVLLPALLKVDLGSGFEADGQRLLRTWDGSMSADSAAAAYFAAVWNNVLRLTFADDLPDHDAPTNDSRWIEVMRHVVDVPDSPWWDDRSTLGVVEGRDGVLRNAMIAARQQLTAQLGVRADEWRWGLLHQVRLEHPLLGGSGQPGVLRGAVNPAAQQVSGGSSSVDATGWDPSTGGFAVTAGPSMRMVVDLADLDSSTWVDLTGTSGHPASPHYSDQLSAWAAGRQFPWPFSAAATQADARSRLTLQPSA